MSDKIRILYFMDGIGNAGGIQEMAIKWMENIDHKKFQIDILSYNTGKQDNYADRVRALGGEVYIIDTYMRKGKLIDSLKQTNDFFRTHSYDILHAHSSSKAVFILWFARKYGIKTRILHSHCTQFVVRGKKALMFANLLKLPTKLLTTDFFACSPEAGEFLFGKKATTKNKVIIAHNGIDISKYIQNDSIRCEMRKQLGIENNFVIGNVGRFRSQKNHEFLIDIFKEITMLDSTAVLVCVGNGELEELIREKAISYGIVDKILFLGFRNDVNDLMQSFDLLLMPSLFEGLPVTGVEAQAVGVPALFADTITKDAAILPESTYLSLTDSPKVWAEHAVSYKNISHNPEPYKWIKDRGYDIEIETDKLAEFYINKMQ